MNRKAIKSIFRKKFNDWISTIDNESVKQLVEKNSIISGGAIVNLLLNEKPNDYDIYFTNKETVLAVANYYVSKFNEAHKNVCESNIIDENERIRINIRKQGFLVDEKFNFDDDGDFSIDEKLIEDIADIVNSDKQEKPKYRPVYLTDNAITLSDKMQLIIRFYGKPEEIHKNYDFIHCMNYWESSNDNLFLNPEAIESILNKELKYSGSLYPIASIIRTRKFLKKGWKINAGQYLKMCLQLSKLDLNDINILREQLIGVDLGYFNILIKTLVEQKEKNPTFTFDDNYVISIIDKIF